MVGASRFIRRCLAFRYPKKFGLTQRPEVWITLLRP
jgi:hypothetical protein